MIDYTSHERAYLRIYFRCATCHRVVVDLDVLRHVSRHEYRLMPSLAARKAFHATVRGEFQEWA